MPVRLCLRLPAAPLPARRCACAASTSTTSPSCARARAAQPRSGPRPAPTCRPSSPRSTTTGCRDIRFRPDHAPVARRRAAVRGACSSTAGRYHPQPVRIHEVDADGSARADPLRAAPTSTTARNKLRVAGLAATSGYAGFRVHYPLNIARLQGRADRLPGRELLPRARRGPAATACRRAGWPSTRSAAAARGVPALHRVLARAAGRRARRSS